MPAKGFPFPAECQDYWPTTENCVREIAKVAKPSQTHEFVHFIPQNKNRPSVLEPGRTT